MSDAFTDISREERENIKRYMVFLEKKYQDENPCPNCGSHNVHIKIDAIGSGVAGSEYCDDCSWRKVTNTFKNEV
jgi:hypothetical protein